MINTIPVEDDLYIQKHFAERLKSNDDFCLVGVYRDAFEAEKNCDGSIRLILMDVQTQHKHSGLAAAERIKKVFPNIKIVAVTSLVDPEILSKAKTGAADSLWYKDHGTAELLDVIKRTLDGENVFPSSSPSVEMEKAMSKDFSPRQLDILRWYIRGLTNVTLFIYKDGEYSSVATLTATARNMVRSQEEAVENTIKLCNLQTYKNGKSEIGKDAQYGENTYSTIHVTTENYEKDFFVTYANRGESDKTGLLVKLEINNKNIKADDPFIKELLDSLKIVMA